MFPNLSICQKGLQVIFIGVIVLFIRAIIQEITLRTTLNIYLQRAQLHPSELAGKIGKTRQCVLQWMGHNDDYIVEYDGRSFQVGKITAPSRIVYQKEEGI